MHQAYCVKCFSVVSAGDSVCLACGGSAQAMSSQDYADRLAAAATELVQRALRHPGDVTEGLEIVRSLQRFPHGLFRTAALRTLLVQHPASAVREAALRALANGRA